MDKIAEESKEVVSLKALDDLFAKVLRINMVYSSAQSRIENIFVSYHSILRRQGLFWLLKGNQKLAVFHVLLAIRPESLRFRLDSNLQFSHQDLCKDFKALMKHAIKFSEAYQLVNSGLPQKPTDMYRRVRKSHSGNKDGTKISAVASSEDSGKQDTNIPICLYPPHHAKPTVTFCARVRHVRITKKTLLKAHADDLANTSQ